MKDRSNELNALLKRLRPFQVEGFNFATKNKDCNGRLLVADEMGLGKTVTSLAIMLAYSSEWPLLILCPASLRYTWPSEIEKFYPWMSHQSVYVVQGFDDNDFYSNPQKKKRIKIVIATYSLLQNRSAAARVLQQFKFKCVIADESHNIKEKTSQRCKLAIPLLLDARRLLLLSGTPALARPVELWAQLHCIDKDLFGSYTNFTKTYCNARRGRFGWDVSGLSNADDLHAKLKTVMIRRLKADVLSDLPAKQRCIVPVAIQKAQDIKDCREIIAELKETRLEASSLVRDDEASEAHRRARTLLMEAYQASGVGKAQSVAEYVLDWLKGSGTQKVLVFAHHKHVLDTIEAAVSKHLKGVGHIRIDGSVPPAERAASVKKFQAKAQVRLAILSITAAGVGLTLTAASSVIFAELHWTPGVLAQAEDRCHRIGQTNAVNIMFCVCKDEEISIDMTLWNMLGRKVNNLGRIIDGEKGCSLNAEDAENKASSDQELVSFFADNCPDAQVEKKRSPVRGSIESFFKKSSGSSSSKPKTHPLKATKSSMTQKTVTPDWCRCETSPLKVTIGKSTSVAKTKSRSTESLKASSWTCDSCTFLNPAHRISCKMCGAMIAPQIEAETTVKCQKCTYENNRESLTCKICHSFLKPGSKASSNIIELINENTPDDVIHSERPEYVHMNKSRKSIGGTQVVDLIDNSGEEKPSASNAPKRQKLNDVATRTSLMLENANLQPLLSFTVSRNSGRVAIHDANSGEPMSVSFDVENIVNEETSEEMLMRKLKRSGSAQQISLSEIVFEDAEVEKVARNLCKSNPYTSVKFNIDSVDQLSSEIKSFSSSFISLREIEKKSIKKWALPIKPNGIKQTLCKIVSESVQRPKTTARYAGGRKEKALENLDAGNATMEDHRVLNGMACAWCGGNLPKASFQKGVESTYCSQECAEEGRLRRGGMYASTRVRAQVFSLENGICQKCGIDANALYLRINSLEPPERLNALMAAKWKLPKSSKALQNLLHNPKESDFWQADHILAVAEGGGDAGLDNLRTLCSPCHQVETERLRGRLKLVDKSNSDTKESSRDIRTWFASQSRPMEKAKEQQRSSSPVCIDLDTGD